MPINTGGPAYPSAQMVYKTLPHGAETIKAGEPGMTLLDHFAGLAMASLILNPKTLSPEVPLSVRAYEIARCMLAEKRSWENNGSTKLDDCGEHDVPT